MATEDPEELPDEAADEEVEEEPEEETASSSPLNDPEYLRQEYHENERTQADIAEEHGVTPSTVSHYMRKHEIDSRIRTLTDGRIDDAEWLEERYLDDEMSMQAIADEVGCSDGTVMRRLNQFEIPTRSRATGDEEPGPFAFTSEVKGVGEAKLGALQDDGTEPVYESDEEVAEASVEDLGGQHGWSEGLAEDVVEAFEDYPPEDDEEE